MTNLSFWSEDKVLPVQTSEIKNTRFDIFLELLSTTRQLLIVLFIINQNQIKPSDLNDITWYFPSSVLIWELQQHTYIPIKQAQSDRRSRGEEYVVHADGPPLVEHLAAPVVVYRKPQFNDVQRYVLVETVQDDLNKGGN